MRKIVTLLLCLLLTIVPAGAVEVLVDEELMTRPLLGVHPCDNTATLWITPQQLSIFLSSRGNAVTFAAI